MWWQRPVQTEKHPDKTPYLGKAYFTAFDADTESPNVWDIFDTALARQSNTKARVFSATTREEAVVLVDYFDRDLAATLRAATVPGTPQ